jgi:hypothetical protein
MRFERRLIGWEGQIHSWRASQFSRFRRSAVTDHQRKGDDWVSEDELCVKNTLNPCSRVLIRLGSETRTDDPSFKSNGPLLFAKMSVGDISAAPEVVGMNSFSTTRAASMGGGFIMEVWIALSFIPDTLPLQDSIHDR